MRKLTECGGGRGGAGGREVSECVDTQKRKHDILKVVRL